MNETNAPSLGAAGRVFRPAATNIASAYLTATLLSASGAGLTLVMMRQMWVGLSAPLATLGMLIGGALFAGGVRVLSNVRQYDQLELQMHEHGLAVSDGQRDERLAWTQLTRIEELTFLDSDAVPDEPETPIPRRQAGAVVLCRDDGWRMRLDHNRIEHYAELIDLLKQHAEAAEIPWQQVETTER